MLTIYGKPLITPLAHDALMTAEYWKARAEIAESKIKELKKELQASTDLLEKVVNNGM